ncbi:5-formyltetrahydrofolate cyclo-ligase [Lactobacillus xylocopicola]|uniref:5-formyltetrahydrofolate cyclo-ligase n=1 Tax=Lactobacillus xylocopicola TaxID=2976676 RepID=A0ABM8BHH3_9LACO|nr:5-formyltetrahydrofolate cyclo-ligase [Lactobacillus xylocopicola]BDR60719.1 5-formyltetrahydrofolate cyclo-ligase [Lactobacillus xylocopicola]
MDKKKIRQAQITHLTAFAHSAAKKTEDQKLLKQLLNSGLLEGKRTVGVTSSLSYEVDTAGLIAYLWDQGKEVYLARANNNLEHSQDFLYYSYMTKIKQSPFGVTEVADPNAEINNCLDLVLVPGLAFAVDTHQRLGFGGGYYDRFLAKHPNTETVALVNSQMILATASWQPEATDIPVQTIVTTQSILHK